MSEEQPLVLLIEDEPQMVRFFRTLLPSNGYRVIAERTGESGIAAAAHHQPAVVLLDLGLPDIDGADVTRRIREWSDVPIIVISARHRETDKIQALDLGADDYLTKPFSSGELLARLRVALRRIARRDGDEESATFALGDLHIDYARRRVSLGSTAVKLTPLEYKLLTYLARHAGRVLTHGQILRAVWGRGSTEQAHYVRVYMRQLRRKLERDPARPRYLITVIGVGYRLDTGENAES